MKHKDGGPAFPRISGNGDHYPGMSLRDYFAAKALEGIMQCWYEYSASEKYSLAVWAYDMADAMLKAREVKS